MKTITVGSVSQISESAFASPAYRPPRYEIGERWGEDYTGENPAAHGNIVVTEEEADEGRQRLVAVNGNHREVGPWSPTRKQREDYERRQAEIAQRAAEAEEDATAAKLGIEFVSRNGEHVVVRVREELRSASVSSIREAAQGPWDPRLTSEQAAQVESEEDRLARLAYRSLARRIDQASWHP